MTQPTIEISVDKSKMDVDLIQGFLSKSYWAEGRTIEQVRATIDNSIPFGLFFNGQQIAFARVVTDRVVFAYLMDVFVVPEHRGHGYASRLLKYILNYPEIARVQTWLLKTKDAHPLYEKMGFVVVNDAERWMIRSVDEPSR